MDTTSISNVVGSRNNPAASTDAPNPYPARAGVCTKLGISVNPPYSANPSSIDATLAPTVPRWVSIPMSTSGSAARRSTTTQSTPSTTVAANGPRTRPDVQPQARP